MLRKAFKQKTRKKNIQIHTELSPGRPVTQAGPRSDTRPELGPTSRRGRAQSGSGRAGQWVPDNGSIGVPSRVRLRSFFMFTRPSSTWPDRKQAGLRMAFVARCPRSDRTQVGPRADPCGPTTRPDKQWVGPKPGSVTIIGLGRPKTHVYLQVGQLNCRLCTKRVSCGCIHMNSRH